MYGDTLPSEATPSVLPRMSGVARMRFVWKDGATRLADLDQKTPLRVLFPQTSPGAPKLAAITTVSGGLVGGDTLAVDVAVGKGAAAVAIGQAAEKVYRSIGPDSTVDVSLNVGSGAWLEWLPQETILFDGARLARRTVADVDPAGQLMAGECLVFGRLASGEIMSTGFVSDRWEIRIGGRLEWADALQIDNDIVAALDNSAGFGGARAYATAVYVGADAKDHLDVAKELTSDCADVRAGATCRGQVLIARWLGAEPLAVRRGFEQYWIGLRGAAGGHTDRLSRLWYV
jgi:urease accessory protein